MAGAVRQRLATRNYSLSDSRRETAVEVKLALEINGRIEITFHPSARRCTHGQDTGIGQLCEPYQGIRQCFDVARRIERAGFLLERPLDLYGSLSTRVR